MIRIESAIIKHNGLMNDKGTKVTLYLPELSDRDVLALNKLAVVGVADLILMDAGLLSESENART
jgi:hypothetical protein